MGAQLRAKKQLYRLVTRPGASTGLDPANARCSAMVAPDAQKAGAEPCDVAMTGGEVETSFPDTQTDEAGSYALPCSQWHSVPSALVVARKERDVTTP